MILGSASLVPANNDGILTLTCPLVAGRLVEQGGGTECTHGEKDAGDDDPPPDGEPTPAAR